VQERPERGFVCKSKKTNLVGGIQQKKITTGNKKENKYTVKAQFLQGCHPGQNERKKKNYCRVGTKSCPGPPKKEGRVFVGEKNPKG